MSMSKSDQLTSALLVIAFATAGGVLGYFAFFWVATQRLYALVLPGGLLGLAASMAPVRWVGWAVICGAAALVLGLFTEWRFAPWLADGSLSYFLAHLHQLRPMTWIMIVVGAAVGFFAPFNRYRRDHALSLRDMR